jgi:hypothetical protein
VTHFGQPRRPLFPLKIIDEHGNPGRVPVPVPIHGHFARHGRPRLESRAVSAENDPGRCIDAIPKSPGRELSRRMVPEDREEAVAGFITHPC